MEALSELHTSPHYLFIYVIKLLVQGHPITVFSRMLLNAVLGCLEYF